MKIIIKPFSEIMIKSKPVRKRYLQILQTNIARSLKMLDENIKTNLFYDKLEVNFAATSLPMGEIDWGLKEDIIKKLQYIPGVEFFIDVETFELERELLEKEDNSEIFDFIFGKAKDFYLDKITNKTFVARVKRNWKHNFNSIDLERYVWWGLLKYGENAKVKLKNPDLTIKIEIKDNSLFLVRESYFGVWGYPVWTQDRVISLISWWFDSGVSTYQMMRRWCKTDYLFFNLGGSAHELWVKQVSSYLWKNFWVWYDARFVTIPFEDVVKELVEKVDSRFRWVLLKRYFLKVADKLAKDHHYYAIVQWDSLGQVSSQTLKNMHVIDKASDTLVLRPLIWFNKQEIIDITRQIWTYNFACNMPEYCGVISDKPATWATLDQVLEQEARIDESILDKAIENWKLEYLKKLLSPHLASPSGERDNTDEIEISYVPEWWEIVIDIREEADIKKRPIILENTEILQIPFTNINSEFKKLDQSKTYLFYCDKWVLSKLHWLYLKELGFDNIKIYRYLEKGCKLK